MVPGFRNMGVPSAMFAMACNNARVAGYKDIEASSVSWKNASSIAEAVRAGGVHYKTYVVFGKPILDKNMGLQEIYGAAAYKFTEPEMFNRVSCSTVS